MPRKDDLKEDAIKKVKDTNKDANIKEIERSQLAFSVKKEISKIKISNPI